MPQKVRLAMGNTEETVIVEKAILSDEEVRLEGFDPSQCPAAMKEGIQFASFNLSGIIYPESPIRVEAVEPTDEPVPEPEVHF